MLSCLPSDNVKRMELNPPFINGLRAGTNRKNRQAEQPQIKNEKEPPGGRSSLLYERHRQVLPSGGSGTLLPCLPSPSCFRQPGPTPGHNESAMSIQNSQTGSSSTHEIRLFSKGQEGRNIEYKGHSRKDRKQRQEATTQKETKQTRGCSIAVVPPCGSCYG